jgi:hypothetical protein
VNFGKGTKKQRGVKSMQNKDCKPEECLKNCYYSCQVLQHRFNVKECDIGHEIIVNLKHNEEVEKRSDLLEESGITWS